MVRDWPQLLIVAGVLVIAMEGLNVRCCAQPQDQQGNASAAPATAQEIATSVDTADRHDWVIDHPNVLGLSLVKGMHFYCRT